MNDEGMYVNPAAVQHIEGALSALYLSLVAAAGQSDLDARNLVRELDAMAEKLESKAHSLQLQEMIEEKDNKDKAADLRQRAHALQEQAAKLRSSSARIRDCSRSVNVAFLATAACERPAKLYLQDVQEDLKNYLAYNLEATAVEFTSAGSGGGVAGAGGGADTPTTEVALPVPVVASPDSNKYKLPKGFIWFPLDRIAATPEVTALDWGENFPEEMQRWFSVLEKEVLETLQLLGTGRGSDLFRALDNRKGKTPENGILRVYDAFFGDKPIVLSRKMDSEICEISDGYHRIAIARLLGWKAIPVKIYK